MKKTLLFIFAMVMSLAMNAQTTVEFVAGTDKSANSSAVDNDVVTKDGITITVSNGVLGRPDNYRCYQGKTLTVTSTIGNIASIEFTCTASDDAKYGPGNFSDPTSGTYAYSGTSGTWTGDDASVTLTASTAQVRMTKIVVTTKAADGTVAKPSIRPTSGVFYDPQEVTMTAAEGCTIHYTINEGAEQTYAEPFTLSEAGVYAISAYAKDATGKTSDAATAEIEIKEVVNYTTIADMRAACTATSKNDAPYVDFTFTDLLVTGVNGSNTFVSDGTDSYLIYGSNSLELAKGDKISGTIRGQLYLYNQLGELAATDKLVNVTKTSTGNDVTPKVIEITDAIDNYAANECAYVQFQNVNFLAESIGTVYGEANYRTVAITNADGDEINIYDTANLLKETTFFTDKPYNVNCYVVRYNATVQVYVLDVNDIQVITELETPVSAWSAEAESILVGNTAEAKFTTTSDGAVTYTSSDEAVATVSAEGVITAVAVGTCTITAETAETAKYLASTEVIKITVKEVMGGLETFVNGGFEEWVNDSQPTGWKSTTTASSATLEKSTDAHGGEYSVLIKNATGNKRLGSKEFLMPAGWYTIEFYAKSATETPAQARPGYAPWDDENGKMGSYVYGDYTADLSNTEWTLVKFVFELTEQTQLNLVVMNPKSTDTKQLGDLLVDDFVFRAATNEETGIEGVFVEKTDNAIYNLAGQKVDNSFKGIVIQNGKKFIRK